MSTPADEFNAALKSAQSAISFISKNAVNEHHKFRYASADAVVDQAKAVLLNADLVVRRIGAGVEHMTPTSCVVVSTFEVLHVASGHSERYVFSVPAEAGKGRPLDKAVLGVQTSVLGYFMRDLLLLPRYDEDEASNRDDRSYDPDAIGEAAVREIQPRFDRLGVSSDWVRAKALKSDLGEQYAEQLRKPIRQWPKVFLPRIYAALDALEKQRTTVGASIDSLPQTAPRPAPSSQTPSATAPVTEPGSGAPGPTPTSGLDSPAPAKAPGPRRGGRRSGEPTLAGVTKAPDPAEIETPW